MPPATSSGDIGGGNGGQPTQGCQREPERAIRQPTQDSQPCLALLNHTNCEQSVWLKRAQLVPPAAPDLGMGRIVDDSNSLSKGNSNSDSNSNLVSVDVRPAWLVGYGNTCCACLFPTACAARVVREEIGAINEIKQQGGG